MSWHDSLLARARKTASRRQRIYDLDPSPDVSDILARDETDLAIPDSFRLLAFILFSSPLRKIKLLWQNLADQDTPKRIHQIELLAQELRSQLGESSRVVTRFFERRNYSRDLARVPALMEKLIYRTTPYLVVQPQDERDISRILAFCSSKGLSVFPRGAASFAFGGAVPTQNGVVVDLSPMMAIIEVDPESQTIRVQPGARWADVAAQLELQDLAPKSSPTSRFSTVAGWISTGGMGLDSYAFGNVSHAVAEVRVARADGQIEILSMQDDSLRYLFGTEGQFGILTEVTLRVRPKPEHSSPLLLTFDTPAHAIESITSLNTSGHQPTHVVFFDKAFMQKENILFREHTHLSDPIVPEKDTVLLHFEDSEGKEKYLSSLNGNSQQILENRVASRYLWSDRYFPLKAQRLSRGLLGSEVVLPSDEIPRYMKKVQKLGRHFKISPTAEVIVCREDEGYTYLVIIAFNCDYSRSLHYALSLLFIQLLVRLAVRRGGHPYGIGIWNTPFVKSKFADGQLSRFKQKKEETDPQAVLSPNKFFKIKGRFFSIPALALQPQIFRAILAVCHFGAPVLGLVAKLTAPEQTEHWKVPGADDEQGKRLLFECSQRCTSCGACISVCPAYHITQDELVTGRTKLRMAETMISEGPLQQAEAFAPFQCLHCGLCEEVCQTHLPLRDCYLVLEDWVEKRFGSPTETVASFLERLDQNREFINNVFGLDIPDWSPEEKISRVPLVERSQEGEGA